MRKRPSDSTPKSMTAQFRRIPPLKLTRWTLPFLPLLLTSCTDGATSREEVIQRFLGGEKKVVARYEGQGASERLVERFTYDKTGDLVLKEDLIHNVALNWVEMNPSVNTPEGLKRYLQGTWSSEPIEDPDMGSEVRAVIKITVAGDKWVFETETTSAGQASRMVGDATVTYRPNLELMVHEHHKASGPKAHELTIEGKNSYSIRGAGSNPTGKLTYQRMLGAP